MLARNTLLKIDHWTSTHGGVNSEAGIPVSGASNLRRVKSGLPLFAVSQPTGPGVNSVYAAVVESLGGAVSEVLWVNLREEPFVYINEKPFVLRDAHNTLRNTTALGGIAAEKLEAMEERLKENVLAEAVTYNGRVLVHGEAAGRVTGIWESVESVMTPR